MVQTTQLFRAGLRLPSSVVIPSEVAVFIELASSSEWAFAESPHLLAGLCSAAFEASPDSPEWLTDKGVHLDDMLSDVGLPEETPEWNLYFLGRYAYSGNDADLAELVRRARHRDGSTATIVVSSDACMLLDSAAGESPEVLAKLRSMGLNPASVQFGNFPPLKSSAPGAVHLVASPAPIAKNADDAGGRGLYTQMEGGLYPGIPPAAPEAPPQLAGLEDSKPEPPAGVNAEPDFVGGTVKLSGKVEAALSITRALGLLDKLTESTQRLLIPAEGFMWINDLDSLAAALVVLDGVLARRLNFPERSGVYALRAGLATVWLAGELVQSTEDGPQFGRYKVMMFRPDGGFDEFGNYEDFNDAKFELAKRIRAVVAALPA